MAALQFENKWILITGASSGLGYEMALQLTLVHKANVILVARRADKLDELKHVIISQSSSKVKTVTAISAKRYYPAGYGVGRQFVVTHLEQ